VESIRFLFDNVEDRGGLVLGWAEPDSIAPKQLVIPKMSTRKRKSDHMCPGKGALGPRSQRSEPPGRR